MNENIEWLEQMIVEESDEDMRRLMEQEIELEREMEAEYGI